MSNSTTKTVTGHSHLSIHFLCMLGTEDFLVLLEQTLLQSGTHEVVVSGTAPGAAPHGSPCPLTAVTALQNMEKPPIVISKFKYRIIEIHFKQ